MDFKFNKTKYERILRKEYTSKVEQAKFKANLNEESEEILVECPNCNYTCKMTWKKCPICKTKIKNNLEKQI
ncbi:MAG: hypothetical protein ACFFC3_15975 [Candidatus Odinarchaeota archaeon]